MRILLINYGQADNNSAYHILGHARALAARGHDVCVGVAKSVPEGCFEHRDGFRLASHRTLLKMGARFADALPADILHVWTPRESVRLFTEKYTAAWGASALVIHLEDNEAAIFEKFTGRRLEEAMDPLQEWSKGLIHPARFTAFLGKARGITCVHRCLYELAPRDVPCKELVPIMDFDFFSGGFAPPALRAELGIPEEARVLVFNGNDHAATALDILRLYEVVDLLLERGRNVVFVRTGHVLPANYEGLHFRPGPRCIELGFVERHRIPDLMRLADVVIQPGEADPFNSYRLPAKVPEYLSMGKPLIMGACNIGLELAGAGAARILASMAPADMADAVDQLLHDAATSDLLSHRARAFALARFDESLVIPRLEAFYHRLAAARPGEGMAPP